MRLSRRGGVAAVIATVALGAVVVGVAISQSGGPSPGPPSSSTTAGTGQSSLAGLKPQLAGLVDQHKAPASAYRTVVPGHVVEVKWSDLQPTGASSLDTSPLDTAIAAAARTNARLKVDLLAGQYAPQWVKDLPVTAGVSGAFTICNTRGQRAHCGQVGHFWEADYEAAYANLQQLLAARYDDTSQIAQIDITGCMTIFEEPLLRQGNVGANVAAYARAGYSEAANEECERAQIRANAVWRHTQSSIALNPYERWTGSGFVTDEAFTESLISYCRHVLAGRCVLGNDSIGKQMNTFTCAALGAVGSHTKNAYSWMYTAIRCAGRPIYFRTATPAKLLAAGNTLDATIGWATTMGAASVELPVGYDEPGTSGIYLPAAQLSPLNAGLAANGAPAP